RRDPVDRVEMRRLGAAPRIGKRRSRPGQQREDLEEFLRVTGGNATLGVDLALALERQGGRGRADVPLHPGQGKARVDEACQCLEPRQAGCRLAPAPREEDRLLAEAAE